MKPSSCRDVRELLHSVVSDELSVEALHAVRVHLRACGSCRGELRALRQLRVRLRSALGSERAPAALVQEVRAHTVDRPPSTSRVRRLGVWLTSGAAVLVVLALWMANEAPMSASALLDTADLRQREALQLDSGLAVARTLSLEEEIAPGHRVALGVLELVTERATGRVVRRRADDAAAKRQVSLGADTSNHTSPAGRGPRTFDIEDLWQLTLTIDEFRSRFFSERTARVVREADAYVIHSGPASRTPSTVEAALWLTAADLKPTMLVLTIRAGTQHRTFVVRERLRQMLPDLPDVDQRSAPERVDRGVSAPPPPASTRPAPPAAVDPGTELAALQRLRQTQADVRERVALVRQAGRLFLRGTAPSESRRREIASTVTGIASNVIVDQMVTQPSDDLDRTNGAASTSDWSQLAAHRAILLRDVVQRFPEGRRRCLAPDDMALWHSLIRDHARGVALALRMAPSNDTCVAPEVPQRLVPDASHFESTVGELVALTTKIASGVEASERDASPSCEVGAWRREASALAEAFDRPWSIR